MKKRFVLIDVVLTVALLLALAVPSWGVEVELKPEYYAIKDFKFKSGQSLPEMKVEHATWGTPKKDTSGKITNAVVFCHGWSGSYTQIKLMKDSAGPGRAIDPERFFYILPTALGSPGSYSPSTSGLGAKFPKYTVADMVKAQYLLVTNHLKIEHLSGVMGPSMGGFQALQWITDYPDMMDWAVPIATGPDFKGRNVGVFGLMSELVRSDPTYNNGEYKEQPKAGLRLAFMNTYLFYFTPSFFMTKFKTPEAVMQGLENAGLGSDKMDANDVIWRNDAMMAYDVKAKLPQVKAKALVVGVNDDELFPAKEEFKTVAEAIPGAELFAYDSMFGHLGCALDIGKANQAMLDFLNKVCPK